MGAVTLFDLAALDPATREFVQERTTEIRLLMRRTAGDIVDIGLKLIEVKERLGHGQFLPWLAGEFEWSYPSAARFMQVAERFGAKSSQIENFAPSALYLLAAPSTPEPARQEALALAEGGEEVTHGAARAIIDRHRSMHQPEPEPANATATAQGCAVEPEGGKVTGLDGRSRPATRQPASASPAPRPHPPDVVEEDEPERKDAAAAKPAPRYPSSDQLAHAVMTALEALWVGTGQRGGNGLRDMLADRDGWDWRRVEETILPNLDDLSTLVETCREEVRNAAQ